MARSATIPASRACGGADGSRTVHVAPVSRVGERRASARRAEVTVGAREGPVQPAGGSAVPAAVIEKDDQYVLNHCTRFLARDGDEPRHDFGQYAPRDPRATFNRRERELLGRLVSHLLPFRLPGLRRLNYIDKVVARAERHHLDDYRTCVEFIDDVLEARNPGRDPLTLPRDASWRRRGAAPRRGFARATAPRAQRRRRARDDRRAHGARAARAVIAALRAVARDRQLCRIWLACAAISSIPPSMTYDTPVV